MSENFELFTFEVKCLAGIIKVLYLLELLFNISVVDIVVFPLRTYLIILNHSSRLSPNHPRLLVVLNPALRPDY
jgi:hypothetical protein